MALARREKLSARISSLTIVLVVETAALAIFAAVFGRGWKRCPRNPDGNRCIENGAIPWRRLGLVGSDRQQVLIRSIFGHERFLDHGLVSVLSTVPIVSRFWGRPVTETTCAGLAGGQWAEGAERPMAPT